MSRRVVKVLERDAELAEGLAGERLARARREVRANGVELPVGRWQAREWPLEVRDGLGLLVLDGLLLRRVGLDGRFGGELLSGGDLLRPWQHEDASASLTRSSGWRVLAPTSIAVLDLEFARRAAPYPELHGRLLARMLRRARQLAVIMAIVQQPRVETRVLMLLWHLADRWGVVRADGVLVPSRLTHDVLAELLAARRPTVSAALGELRRNDLVRILDRGWLLPGTPPGELSALRERA